VKLSVEALPVAPNQPLGQGPGMVRASGDDTFRQMLQALVAVQAAQVSGPIALPSNVAGWLATLMGSARDAAPALDPTGEASTAAQGELTVPLTEVLAALQPVVNQSMAGLQAGQLDSELLSIPAQEEDQPETESQPELMLLALSSLLGQVLQVNSIPAPTDTPPPAPAASAASPTGVAAPSDVMASRPDGSPPLPVAFGKDTGAAQVVSAHQDDLPASPAPATTNPMPSHDTSLPTDGKAAVFALPDEATPGTRVLGESRPAATGRTTARQAEPEFRPTAPVAETVATPFSVTVPKLVPASRGVPAEPVAGLPAVPALHQIVRAVELISQRGDHEVRLQLQPPALGQLLVQLQVSDGDVSVRMLAETSQAQSLIRDHLPELKAAFTAQGFQVDQLAVAVGADMSAFDMGQQQAQAWGRADQPVAPVLAATKATGGEQHGSRLSESLHAVDYQV